MLRFALALLVVLVALVVAKHWSAAWLKRRWFTLHRRFVEQGAQGNIDILFLGDSITAFWQSWWARRLWESTYAGRGSANFAIGGDTTENILWRLRDGELSNVRPRVAVLLAGINDLILRGEPVNAVQGIIDIVSEVQTALPDCKVLVLAIFPSAQPGSPRRKLIEEANTLLRARLEGRSRTLFIDIGSRFLESDGTLSRSVMPDLVHLSTRGYRIWVDAMEKPLQSLLH